MYHTISVAKTKALISCAVTAQLICTFVFAKAKIRLSHDEAPICHRFCTVTSFMLSALTKLCVSALTRGPMVMRTLT